MKRASGPDPLDGELDQRCLYLGFLRINDCIITIFHYYFNVHFHLPCHRREKTDHHLLFCFLSIREEIETTYCTQSLVGLSQLLYSWHHYALLFFYTPFQIIYFYHLHDVKFCQNQWNVDQNNIIPFHRKKLKFPKLSSAALRMNSSCRKTIRRDL